jgi:hypothetical protein
MKLYTHRKLPTPVSGFLIIKPDGTTLWDFKPVEIVKELNRLQRRIKQLETQVDEMMADNCYKDTHE